MTTKPPTDYSAGARILALGDSILHHNHFALTTPGFQEISNRSRGELTWAETLDPRFDFSAWYDPSDPRGLNGLNLGYSGGHTETVIDLLPRVIQQKPDIVVLAVGTNDINSNDAVAVILGNLQEIVDRLVEAGIHVVFSTIRPRAIDGIYAWPEGNIRWEKWQEVNDWIRAYATDKDGVSLWDPVTALGDAANGHPERFRPEMTEDGVHLSGLGGYESAKTLLPILRDLVDEGLAFDPDPAAGNLIANGALEGDTGTLGTGVSGTLASGWAMTRAGGGSTVVGSKIIEDGDEAQAFEFTPGGSAAFDTFQLRPVLANQPVGAQFGEWLQIGIKVDVDAWDGWRGISVSLTDAQTGFATFGLKWIDRSRYPFPSEDWDGWIWSEAIQVTSATTVLRPLVQVDIAADGASGTGRLVIDDVIMRVVPSPQAQPPAFLRFTAEDLTPGSADREQLGTFLLDGTGEVRLPAGEERFEIDGNAVFKKAGVILDESGGDRLVLEIVDVAGGVRTRAFALDPAHRTGPPETFYVDDARIPEGLPPGSEVGIIKATDPDGAGPITFEIVGTSSLFEIVDGNRLVTRAGSYLDYETARSHTLTLRATDADGQSTTRTLLIYVEDVPDQPISQTGTSGNDVLTAGPTGGALYGLAGNDLLIGSAFADLLDGGANNDTLIGGGGPDTLNGGWGNDIVSYAGAPGPVGVDLLDQDFGYGDAAGDLILMVEGVIGSDFDDVIRGGEVRETLEGGDGNDHISGRGG